MRYCCPDPARPPGQPKERQAIPATGLTKRANFDHVEAKFRGKPSGDPLRHPRRPPARTWWARILIAGVRHAFTAYGVEDLHDACASGQDSHVLGRRVVARL